MPHYIQQLKILKEKLNNQKMSVLVGAGFSKNVCEIFPSWWELLFDMTLFLFQAEIEESYDNLITSSTKTAPDKDVFIKSRINYYISHIGYLDIVSEFIKRKGYNEAITSYIEEKTPKITRTGSHTFLENRLGGKENKVRIKEEMLSQHKHLLDLPWNNIYTTNYDELLEFSSNSSNVQSIESEIQIINIEIQHYQKQMSIYESKINKLKNNYDSIMRKIESLNKNKKNLDIAKINRFEDRANKYQTENRKKEIELRGILKRLNDKEKDLLQLRKAQNECISLVKSSEELSIKRNKNIIKLHGSLRKEDSRYGFDGDIQKQYVISREDYETYPLKHQAFTQLMRISLLQESYCLIGFSGDDINFLEWIKWVREILERGKDRNDYKIYLITVNTAPISADKQLFFENHKIYPIKIMEDEVFNFLNSETGMKVKKSSTKSALELFFKYLKGKNQINISKTTFETLQYNKYKRSWDSLNPEDIDYTKINNTKKTIEELKLYSRLPSLDFAYSSKKQHLLFYSKKLIKNVSGKYKDALLTLVILAVKETYLTPTDFVWDKADLTKIEDSIYSSTENIQKQFSILMLRDSVLRKDEKSFLNILNNKLLKKSDDILYESILFSAFSLDYKSLKCKIDSWNPKSTEGFIKKAGFLALFDSKTALQFLSQKLGNPTTSCQEELYLLELYHYLKLSVEFSNDKESYEAIKRYNHFGFNTISENIDYLIKEVNRNKDKIKRYGKGRFGISNDFSFTNDFTLPQKGLQFIQQLIETGFPITTTNAYWKNHKDCYPLFKEIIPYFPYPVIFYSLQFSDEDFLRRLGQDFASTEHLFDYLDEIVGTLLNSYLNVNTPHRFKQSILYLSSEILIGIDPERWQHHFFKIWVLDSFKMRCFEERGFAERTFTIACLPYLQDQEIITKIIYSIFANPKSKYSVELLYNLAINVRLKELGDSLQSKELAGAIESIIEMINLTEYENIIFMLGNIYPILTDSQKNRFFEKFKDIKFDNIKNERLWNVLTYFSAGRTEINNRIKSAIIKNKALFNSGFTDKGLSIGVYFIQISRLTNPENTNNLDWTKIEAIQIYDKIVLELEKIENWLARREHKFTSILHEMKLFLEYERPKIEGEKNFSVIFDKINFLYREHRGYNLLLDGLVANDKTIVVWALSELSIIIHQKKTIAGHEFELTTFLNKVLLQTNPALEESLNYLAAWINNENLSESFKIYDYIILSILKRYTNIELEEFDKPFVYKQLVDIANTLNSWGIQEDVIKYWLIFERETSYNNIRFGKKR